MAKGTNQKMKLLYLMKIFLEKTDEKHGLTINELISELALYDVSAERKSLYDDIELLCVFGLDIEKQRDKNVTYRVLSRDFEMPELKLLVDAVQSSKFITHKKSSELIKKVEALTSRFGAQELQRQVYVSNRIKTMNESIYYTVDKLHDAINQNKKISFQYFDYDQSKQKVLRHNGKLYKTSPQSLCWDDENYYLIAFDSDTEEIRHYRVDKMLSLKIIDEKRDGRELFEKFDMALYSKKTFGMFSGKEQSVTLLCENSLAHIMLDRFGMETSFFRVDDNHFKFTVKVSQSPLFLSWLVNFGDKIKILSPQCVIDEFKTLLKKSLEQY